MDPLSFYSSSVPSHPSRETKVRFDKVSIYEFPVILGVEVVPSSGGAPLALSSKSTRELTLDLEHFETIRPKRRAKRNLILDAETRTSILLKSGYSFEQIANAALSSFRILKARQESVQDEMVKSKQFMNKMVDSTRRAIKNVVKPMKRSEGALTA